MDITIHASFLPHDDPEASVGFYRDILGFEVRNDVGYNGMHWITVGPAGQPDTSIVLYPPAATPGVTDDERRLIAEFEALAAELIAGLTPSNLALATRIAALPMEMKGYGYIKDANVETAKVKEKALLARFRAGEAAGQLQAAE